MKFALFSFFIILISMSLIDALWLGLMIRRFYAPNIGHLLADSMSFAPAMIFYPLYAFAINLFVVLPALKNETGYGQLLLLGLLFGLVAYGTYDLTNQVTLKNWPWVLTVVDMSWGGFLTATVSLIATFAARYFGLIDSQ